MPNDLEAREAAAQAGNETPTEPPEPEPSEVPEKRKRGPYKKKVKALAASPKALDPETEGEDAVKTIDEIQGFFSQKLKFSESEREFHKRSVELVVKHYEVSVCEGITLAHASASVLMIVGNWTRAAWKWWNHPKAQGMPPTKPAEVLNVETVPPKESTV